MFVFNLHIPFSKMSFPMCYSTTRWLCVHLIFLAYKTFNFFSIPFLYLDFCTYRQLNVNLINVTCKKKMFLSTFISMCTSTHTVTWAPLHINITQTAPLKRNKRKKNPCIQFIKNVTYDCVFNLFTYIYKNGIHMTSSLIFLFLSHLLIIKNVCNLVWTVVEKKNPQCVCVRMCWFEWRY